YARSATRMLTRTTAAGKYAMCWNGRAFSTATTAGYVSSMSMGNMWPERKKLIVLTTYKNDVTSRNQKPIMPMLASKKKPTKKASRSETTYAAKVGRSGQVWKTCR